METLRRPLTALLLAPDEAMWEAAISGAKSISIREGHRDYRAGEHLMVCCHIRDSAFMVTLTEVRHCLLSEVTVAEYSDDGFHSREELLEGLQTFYPTLTSDSPVTLLRWGDARGRAVSRSLLEQ